MNDERDGLHAATTRLIIAAAIEVHRHLGPGLLEAVYERAFCRELDLRRVRYARQVAVPLFYKGKLLSEHRPDLIVDARVVVEIKSIAHLEAVHFAQVLTYLRVTGRRLGLIINFNVAVLSHGVKRVIL